VVLLALREGKPSISIEVAPGGGLLGIKNSHFSKLFARGEGGPSGTQKKNPGGSRRKTGRLFRQRKGKGFPVTTGLVLVANHCTKKESVIH